MEKLGVALVGHAFMGAVHSHAWRTVGHVFDLPVAPDMAVLCGRREDAAEAAAARLGWRESSADWKSVLRRDDVHVVDICTPGDSHSEIAIAALKAGKHVLCEKPLANSVAEAAAMAAEAERAAAAGIGSMVAFNYRRVPALALARELIERGRLGRVRHVRAAYLQDWLVDPEAPLTWRLQAERAGSGALGDLGAHLVDLTQFLLDDEITGVSAVLETFVPQRPLESEPRSTGAVTVDDATLFTARFAGGAVATFEATRYAAGRKNGLRIEVNGSEGSIAFDFESMNELQFHDGTDTAESSGFRRVLATEPGHPYLQAWYPPGHVLGYDHTFTHEIRDFVVAVASGSPPRPGFSDGLRVQRVLDAVQRSAARESRWTAVEGGES
ncbi:putative dehydrogenase [Saccharopolyspora erythraea NRRL 2338]|uniref:Oxidoreductase domain protein n=2 Tax=Saccharopolyspora erythraea TaxID=1836 RepID=A4FDY8_SACEN|nr:Gfo/Idh/MocA family oxidoreductase [Saccharopolyspora erythraea]EQD82463.1 dehydrogenase [Saccharopolyspora erythraea D]PFG95993.1 putative dehydrogenase [Saccharopolyspora erythraea NRRL 2338]QRK92553.1 Gfo/Idh/MocA family oxidoreductase [Saccharopolyspora erythraea]CAM02263.1 oxidoreductase domain protein [Saccharopolyspora erythraea NRRL 2338]